MAYIGKQPLVGNYTVLDSLTATTTDTYALTKGAVAVFPQTPANCIVSLNGVIQAPYDSYTISGSNIVFASALTASDSIDFITVLGDVLNIGTPSDGTVGFAKVTSNLITGATEETSIAGADSVLIYDDSATALRKMTRTNFVSGIGGTNTPNFYANDSSGQSLANATTTKLNYATEIYDTANAFASSRFTVPSGQAGKYHFTAMVGIQQASTVTELTIYIQKNGVTQFAGDGENPNYPYAFASGTLDLIASDYIEVFCEHVFGSAVTRQTSTSSNYFQGFKLIE